jgi:hypothetical protein
MCVINLEETSFYKEFLAQREEINKHKWYESEKAGHDIGFAQALIDWTIKFKTKWLKQRKSKN